MKSPKDKPNPLLGGLADAAIPLLLIGGLLFLRSQNPGAGGIPGLGNQGKVGTNKFSSAGLGCGMFLQF